MTTLLNLTLDPNPLSKAKRQADRNRPSTRQARREKALKTAQEREALRQWKLENGIYVRPNRREASNSSDSETSSSSIAKSELKSKSKISKTQRSPKIKTLKPKKVDTKKLNKKTIKPNASSKAMSNLKPEKLNTIKTSTVANSNKTARQVTKKTQSQKSNTDTNDLNLNLNLNQSDSDSESVSGSSTVSLSKLSNKVTINNNSKSKFNKSKSTVTAKALKSKPIIKTKTIKRPNSNVTKRTKKTVRINLADSCDFDAESDSDIDLSHYYLNSTASSDNESEVSTATSSTTVSVADSIDSTSSSVALSSASVSATLLETSKMFNPNRRIILSSLMATYSLDEDIASHVLDEVITLNEGFAVTQFRDLLRKTENMSILDNTNSLDGTNSSIQPLFLEDLSRLRQSNDEFIQENFNLEMIIQKFSNTITSDSNNNNDFNRYYFPSANAYVDVSISLGGEIYIKEINVMTVDDHRIGLGRYILRKVLNYIINGKDYNDTITNINHNHVNQPLPIVHQIHFNILAESESNPDSSCQNNLNDSDSEDYHAQIEHLRSLYLFATTSADLGFRKRSKCPISGRLIMSNLK